MGNTIKTRVNDASVEDFINSVDNETKRQDSFILLEMYKRATGEQPKMWGASMIGFGEYHYKSGRSGLDGDWALAASSRREQTLTLYVMPYDSDLDSEKVLSKVGKHKTSKGCLYIHKLADVDI